MLKCKKRRFLAVLSMVLSFVLLMLGINGCSESVDPVLADEWPVSSADYSYEDLLSNIEYVVNADKIEKVVCYTYVPVGMDENYNRIHKKIEGETTDSEVIAKMQKELKKAKYKVTDSEMPSGCLTQVAFYIEGKVVYIGGIDGNVIHIGWGDTHLESKVETDFSKLIMGIQE